MKGSNISENRQNNCLKVVIALANFLETNITFYDIKNNSILTPEYHTILSDEFDGR